MALPIKWGVRDLDAARYLLYACQCDETCEQAKEVNARLAKRRSLSFLITTAGYSRQPEFLLRAPRPSTDDGIFDIRNYPPCGIAAMLSDHTKAAPLSRRRDSLAA